MSNRGSFRILLAATVLAVTLALGSNLVAANPTIESNSISPEILSSPQVVTSVQDTNVKEDRPYLNMGDDAKFNAGSQTFENGGDNRGYLQFDLTGLPEYASSAVVRLYGYHYAGDGLSSEGDVSVYRVIEPWDEMNIVWANAAAYVATPVAVFHVTHTQEWFQFDITDLYNSWKSGTANYGLMLDTTTGSEYRPGTFRSRDYEDSSVWPQLVVTAPQSTVIDFESFGQNDQGKRFGVDSPLEDGEYGGLDWAYDTLDKIETWGSFTVQDVAAPEGNDSYGTAIPGAGGSDNWVKARASSVGKGAKITSLTGECFEFLSMRLFTQDHPAFIDEVTVTWRTCDDAQYSTALALTDDAWIEVTAADLGIPENTLLKSMWFNGTPINPDAAKFGLDDYEVRIVPEP